MLTFVTVTSSIASIIAGLYFLGAIGAFFRGWESVFMRVSGAFAILFGLAMLALAFIAFTAVLQFMDGYVIKPKLFGDSLGVSGLLILTAVIVCGNMFGIIGILLAIPLAAILDFVYKDYLLPALEARRSGRE